MKGKQLLIGSLCLLCTAAFAQSHYKGKVIYKWKKNDLVYYSHIRPANVTDFVKLDSQGRKIEDLGDGFGQIVEIAVRPDIPENSPENDGQPQNDVEAAAKEIEDNISAQQEAAKRQKNCEISKKNMATLDSGEVYEPDAAGNMMRLTPEQMASKRANVQRDIDYFCAPQ